MQALLTFCCDDAEGRDLRTCGRYLVKATADGAIIHQQRATITISPYFGNYARLGLFEAYQITDDKKYLEANQVTDGISKQHGSPGVIHDTRNRQHYESTGECDATDSYAATS